MLIGLTMNPSIYDMNEWKKGRPISQTCQQIEREIPTSGHSFLECVSNDVVFLFSCGRVFFIMWSV